MILIVQYINLQNYIFLVTTAIEFFFLKKFMQTFSSKCVSHETSDLSHHIKKKPETLLQRLWFWLLAFGFWFLAVSFWL